MAEIQRSDIISDDALQAPLILAKNFEASLDSLNKFIAAAKGVDDTVGSSNSTKKQREETEKLTVAQQQLLKIEQQIATQAAKDNDTYREQQKTLKTLNDELKTKAVLGEKDAKAVNAQNSSIKELSAALNKNRTEWANLKTEEERTSKKGAELLAIIQQQDAEFKKLSKDMGQAQSNVGNYEGAVAGLKEELKAARDQLAGIAMTLGENSEEYRAAADRAGELADQLNDVQESVRSTAGGTGFERLGLQVGNFQNKLKTLDFKGATASLNQIAGTTKNLTFKQAIQGAGGFGKAMATMAKQLLVHPLFLLVAAIVGIYLAFQKLGKYILPLTKLFGVLGDGIGWVLEKITAFTDAIGLTGIATEEAADKAIQAAEKQRDKLVQAYDDQIAAAQAAGEDTIRLEIAKARAIQAQTERALRAMNKIQEIRRKNRQENEDEYKETNEAIVENTKILHDAVQAQALLRIQQVNQIKETAKQAQAAVEKANHDRAKLNQQRLENEAKIAEDLVKLEGLGLLQRIAASEKAQRARVAKEKSNLNDELKFFKGNIFERQAIIEKSQAAITEIEKKGAEERRNLLISSYQEDAALASQSADNEKNTFDVRQESLKDFLKFSTKALDLQRSTNLISQKQYDAQLISLQQQTTDRLIKIITDGIEKENAAATANASGAKDSQLDLQNQMLDKREISYKEYVKRVGLIEDEYQKDVLKQELKHLNERLAAFKAYGLDVTEVAAQIAAVEKAISDDNVKERIEAEKELQAALIMLKQKAFESASQIADNLLAKELMNIEAAQRANQEQGEAQQEKEEQWLKDRLDRLEKEGMTEEERAAERESIERASEERQRVIAETTEKRNEQLEAKKRREIRKTAIIQKGISLAEAVIAGAEAVVKALRYGPFGVALAVAYGAIAALNIATIASTPIPAAEKGIKGHEGGPIIAGEKGTELVVLPGGKEAFTHSRATLYNLPAGTDIYPANSEETVRALATRQFMTPILGREEQIDTRNELKSIEKTIRNKPTVAVYGRVAGYTYGSQKAEFINSLRNR